MDGAGNGLNPWPPGRGDTVHRTEHPELVTDLYEFTMAASYWKEHMFGEAVFSLFIRAYPPHRSYFVAAGLESFLDYVEQFRFNEDSLSYLSNLGIFPDGFIEYLSNFKFTGSIRALPEGRIFFRQEPLLEICAPLIEAQLLETLAINTLQVETLVATKAARCVDAASGRALVDFALRRTHGIDAGVKTARASYIAGFQGTSDVLAGRLFGIPVYGTMAHSYVTSFPSELQAFRAYARLFPNNTVLLVDTYDTLAGTEKAIRVAKELKARGCQLRGVRLDSGDLLELSQQVRRMLRENDCGEVAVMVSGNLDEYRLTELIRAGAEFDAVGLGTKMGVSADAPYLDMAYKLVEYDGRPILKLSSGKITWVGRKQVWRRCDDDGRMQGDWMGLADEPGGGGEALLQPVMHNGARLRPRESLAAVRKRFADDRQALPECYRGIEAELEYPVRVSERLQALQAETVSERKKVKTISVALQDPPENNPPPRQR